MAASTLVSPQSAPAQGQWTYDDYLKLPDDGKRYEIIEGVLYVANAPSAEHQYTVAEITAEFRNFAKPRRLGRVLPAPFEVHLSESSRPVMPDVLFVRAERWPKEQVQFFAGAPDLVVEVISPTSIRTDRVVKFTAYEQAGVLEYWIANATTRTVEVYVLSSGEYALLGEFTGEQRIQSVVFEGLELETSSLFV